MQAPTYLIGFAGLVALLLWGTHMVTSGTLRAFGGHLRTHIGHSLRGRLRPLGAGIGVTLLLQSSTATGMMASSFASYGLLLAIPGYMLMLGANIGTALVTQIFSLPVQALPPALFLSGYLFFNKSKTTLWKNVGRILIGLGLMFVSLSQLKVLFGDMLALPTMVTVLQAMESEWVLCLLMGILAAWICHSSVAVVLMIMAAVSGGFPLEAAIAMVLGANVGGAIAPVMEAQGNVARRIPAGNLIVRTLGVGAGLACMPFITHMLYWFDLGQTRSVVDLHVAFNLVLAFVAIPFARPITYWVERWLPEPVLPDAPGKPKYLDINDIKEPHLAIANAEREIVRLVDSFMEQTRASKMLIEKGQWSMVNAIGQSGDSITTLGKSIREYVKNIHEQEMTKEEIQRAREIHVMSSNLEHAADILSHHAIEPYVKRMEKGDTPQEQQHHHLIWAFEQLPHAIDLAVSVFMRRDLRAARTLVLQKAEWRMHEEISQKGAARPTFGGAFEVDLTAKVMREARKIHGHLTAIAYEVLEQAGALQDRVSAPVDDSSKM